MNPAELAKKSKDEQVTNAAVTKNFEQNSEADKEIFIIRQVIEVLEEADSIGEADFSNITVRETLIKLAIQALENALKYFSFDELYRKMLKKIFGKMEPKRLEKIFNLFSGAIRERILSEIRRRNPDIDLSTSVWDLEDKKKNGCDYSFDREQLVSPQAVGVDDLKGMYIELMIQFADIDFIDMLTNEIAELRFLKELLANKDEWINKLLAFDLRQAIIPRIPEIPNFSNGGFDIILQKVKDMLVAKAIDLINAALLQMLINILESLEDSILDRLDGEVNDKKSFKDFIRESICGPDGDLDETEKDLMRKAGVSSELASNLADAIGNGFTSSQFNNAVVNPDDIKNNKLYKSVIESTRGTVLENFLTDIDDVKSIFFGMSTYLTDKQLNNLQNLPDDGLVLSDSICLTDDDRETLSRITGKDRVATDKDDSDLDNILDALVGIPLANIADLLGEALEQAEDPDCYDEDSKLLDKIDEDLKDLLDNSSDSVFEAINRSFENDMIGKRTSFFDNLLADTRKIRLRSGIFSHDRRVALDLLFPNAADTLAQHEIKLEDAGFFEKFIMEQFSPDEPPPGVEGGIFGGGKPFPTNLFPETISIYCKEQIESAIDTLDYKITTDKYKNGRKKEELRLKFRNVTENEDLEFDYGFNLLYKDFLYGQKYKKNLKLQVVKIDIDNTEEKEMKIIDTKITNDDSMEIYREIIDELDSGEEINEPYRIYLFKKFLKKKGGINANKTVFELLNKKITQIVLKSLTDNDGANPEGFKFGFNDDDRITYNDLLYVSPKAKKDDPLTWEYDHDEEDKVLGKSATRHPRVKFLDPAKYGGRYTKPKVYIEETEMQGWLGLFNKVVPEVDGAEPKRENYLFLNDVADDVKRLQTTIPNDKRFNTRPDCVQEPAFNKLLDSANKAALEGVIRATLRTYVVEFVLRTIPLLTQLKVDFKNNYHGILTDFIVTRMKETMEQQFSWPSRLKDSRYWYLFLDSCVDLTFRMVEEGRIKPTEDLLLALQEANEVTKNYAKPTEFDRKLLFRVSSYTISNGLVTDVEYDTLLKVTEEDKKKSVAIINSMFYDAYGEEYRLVLSNKKDNSISWTTFFRTFLSLKKIKEITREYDIYTSENISKKVLSFLIRKEILFYSDKLKESFGEPKIKNLNKVLLGKKSGILLSNPVPFVAGPKDNPLNGISTSQEKYDLAKQIGGFFVEYYYTFEKKNKTDIELAKGFEGTKSVKEFKEYINGLPYKTAHLSNYFGNAEIVDGRIKGSIGVKFGVRLNYVPPTTLAGGAKKIKRKAAKIQVGGNLAVEYNESKSYFTIASYERDVVDKTFDEIDLDSPSLGEEVDCYIEQLAKEKEIKFFFDALLITKKIPALVGIYYYDGFIESLGLSESERDEGFIGTKGRWKQRILKQTKEQLAEMFKANYFSRQRTIFGNNFDLFRRSFERLRRNKMPNLRKNLDKSVKPRQLLRQSSRPFDMFGNEHVSPLDGLLGD